MPQFRFNRDYRLTIRVAGQRDVEVRPPMRVAFSADKSVEGGLNKLTLRVYNLRPSSREAIAKDPEQSRVVPVTLSVGYQGVMGTIFKGTIFKASNMRSGPDVITEMECLDGGADVLGSFTSRTIQGNANAVAAVLSDMPNTGLGKMAPVPELQRPRVLLGSSARLLDELVGDDQTWFIDDEQLYITGRDDAVSRVVPVVSAATGLLSVPEREQQRVTFKTVMNPALRLSGLCQLSSTLAPQMDGLYIIRTMGYSGDFDGSDWSQTVMANPAGNYRVLS